MNDDLQYENALTFLTFSIIPSWHALAAMEGHSESERQLILAVPAAIARLPHVAHFPLEVDEEINISAEIDYYWEDKNWLGRLRYKGGELKLWSLISQEEGPSRELCAQWQHTATKLTSTNGLEQHDGEGHLVLIGCGRELRILTCRLRSIEEDDKEEKDGE